MAVTDGLTGVNRVVTLLRHRGTAPQRLTAWAAAPGDTWELEHTFAAGRAQVALLLRQLNRLPCVLTATSRPADGTGGDTGTG